MSQRADGRPVSNINIPNALTVARLLLVPVFIWAYLQGTTDAHWWALVVFVIASITDYLDGQIARSQGLESDFGRLADPLADKALTLSAFIMLSIAGPLPYFWVFTVAVAVREIGITVLREVLRRRGVVVAASAGGKTKTVLQIALIITMLVPWETLVSGGVFTALRWVMAALMLVTFIVTMASGWQYLRAVRTAGK